MKKWAPNWGSQFDLLTCPAFEALIHGQRGRGGTTALALDFAQDIGKGYGRSWRGIFVRRTYPQLRDVKQKLIAIYHAIFPGARYTEHNGWVFPGGETLVLSHFRGKEEQGDHLGHEFPWVGVDELTTWPEEDLFEQLVGCCRTSDPRLKDRIRVRASTNPFGPGFQWVKDRFMISRRTDRKIFDVAGSSTRCAILGLRSENEHLMKADGGRYDAMMRSLKNHALRTAWGDDWGWDAHRGTFFDGSWSIHREDGTTHYPAIAPTRTVPIQWPVYRCLDWGSAKPFYVGWVAVADGKHAIEINPRHHWVPPAGSKILIAEWYGVKQGATNVGIQAGPREVAVGVLEREWHLGLADQVVAGPADGIWAGSSPDPTEATLAAKMAVVRSPIQDDWRSGVSWQMPVKSSGSRRRRWALLREMFEATHSPIPSLPCFFVMDRCEHAIRCLDSAAASPKDPDDIDTDSEDHPLDVIGYSVLMSVAETPAKAGLTLALPRSYRDDPEVV